jgi:poly(A) polymerase
MPAFMADPRVIPRAEHSLSRREIDPDALKVLHRLRQADHVAYLVGGSVRDLLLSRRPKDFDIGTSAHPYQVKKLFRNCWIIGRRFRLAHVKFGTKVIEVATFRRQVQPGEEIVQDGVPAAPTADADGGQLHHDNTFGTPEEDAFRRDFTINALFYDVGTFSIIDYVRGVEDLEEGLVRSIGDPLERFQEDPVRMLRAIALAARLDFRIDEPVLEAIRELRHDITRSSPARLLEEYYKILRGGSAEKTFRALLSAGLLEPVSSELHMRAGEALWRSLAVVDAYRANFAAAPDTLTNAVLLGTLLVPLGLISPSGRHSESRGSEGGRRSRAGDAGGSTDGEEGAENESAPPPQLGSLPLARRDLERLRQILGLQRRLRETGASVRAKRGLTHRNIFREALTWLELHGQAPDVVEHWISVLAEQGADRASAPDAGPVPPEERPERRRRRRRRRRRGPATEQ